MYRFILPILKEKGIDTLFLEVISENIQAIKSYKSAGYKIERELVCYKGEISTLQTNSSAEIKQLKKYNWDLMESFWDTSPTWQNSNNVINGLKDTSISFGAYMQNMLVGYIIYNPTTKRLQQIAFNIKYRRNRIASTLISKLIEEYGSTLSIINVDKSSKPVNSFLKQIGLKKNLEQLEMILQLKRNNSQ